MKIFFKSLVRGYNLNFTCINRSNFVNSNCQSIRFVSSFYNQFKYLNFDVHDVSVSTLHRHHKENSLAHHILESKPNFNVIPIHTFKDSLLKSDPVFKDEERLADSTLCDVSSEELVKIFQSAAVDAYSNSLKPISHPMYKNMCSSLIAKLPECSDDEIASILLYLSLWPMSDSAKNEQFYSMWKALDNTCLERMRQWDISKVLYFMDLWHLIKLTRVSDFVFQSIFLLHKKNNQLTPQQLVQTLFYLNTVRTLHKNIVMYNFEFRLEKYRDELSLDELGVALLGFFKTRTSLKSEDFIKYLIDRTIFEIESISEITLTSILKSLRLSMQIKVWAELPKLLDALVPHMEKFSLQCLSHVALLTSPSQTLHPASLDFASQKLIDNIKVSRMKDMEKVLFPISRLNYNPKTNTNIYSTVVEELSLPSREEEIAAFPRCFYGLLHCLALRSVFPYKLIAKALDMDFIHKTYGPKKYHFGREVTFLDTCLELECKDYNGPRLPQDIRKYCNMRYSHFTPDPSYKMSKHLTLLYDVFNSVKALLGENSVKYIYTVPSHPRPDIVLRAGGLPEEFFSISDFEGPIRAPSDKPTTVLLVVSKNMLCCNSSEPYRLNGETMSKLRGIKLLGHSVKLVFYDQWRNNKSLLEKEEFLEKVLLQDDWPGMESYGD